MSEVDEIKQRLDVVDIVQEYVQLKKAGTNYKGLCPFHQEKSPSFMVSQTKQIWHCFGCHEGGDLFSFVQKVEGMEFYDALKFLGEKAGVQVTKQSNRPGEGSEKQRLLEIIEVAADFFHRILLDHPKAQVARDYVKSRALQEVTVKTFRLGYAPESWDLLLKFLLKRGYQQQEIIKAGLVVYNQERNSIYDRFRHRLMIPLHDVHGNIVGFTARALGEEYHGGKYINTPQTLVYDKGHVVFALHLAKQAVKDAGHVVVVEGNMDAISSHQAGIAQVVAVSGTALTSAQVQQLKRFSSTFIFAFDADAAGLAAARRAAEICLQAGISLKVLTLPYGKDPDECIRHDVHLWKQAIAEATPIIEFLLQKSLGQFDVSTPEGKKGVAAQVLPFLALLENPVERNHYVQAVARELGVSQESVVELVEQSPARGEVITKAGEAVTPRPKGQFADASLLALLLKEPAAMVDVTIPDDAFRSPELRELYKNLRLWYEQGKESGNLHTTFSGQVAQQVPHLQTILSRLELYGDKEFSELSSSQVREAVKARNTFLLRRYLQSELHQIQQQVKAAEQAADHNALEELSRRFAQVSQELLRIDN